VTKTLREKPLQSASSETLDPQNWDDIRAQGHRMLDDMIDYAANIRDRPVWQPIPDEVRARFHAKLPRQPSDLGEVYREFTDFIVPYATGNVHPGFMGWVHGGGTAVGMLAEMLAAGLNANLGGRDHIPIEVERQIVEWTRLMFGFPSEASGIFVTGTSMANLMAVLVARTAALGQSVRQRGVEGASLTAYTSTAAHGCITKAMDIAGFGSEALRCIEVDQSHRIDVAALRARIALDRGAGLKPFLVVGSAGTVDIGAIDDLQALSSLCREEGLWFHVDGAYGALGILSPALAPRLAGLENADSIALDFHKWGQVPYDAGFLIVRDGDRHRQTFSAPAAYLRRETRGLALAVRPRPRSVAGLQGAQDMVHVENLRDRKAGSDDHAQLCARRVSGSPDSGRAAAGAAGAGPAQYCLLPLSRCRRQQGKWRYCHRHSGIRDRGAIDDGSRRPACDTSGYRQSPHRHLRYRRTGLRGAGIWSAAIVF